MPLVLAAILILFAASAADAHVRWHWPVPEHTVLRRFLLGADRYAPGQHRGVTLAAAPGGPVGAVCPGRVTFAGRVGASGGTVAVACGALSATTTHLGAVRVRRGAFLVPGETVGTAGASGRVQLGARVRDRRDGYLDPLRLLAGWVPPVPVGPAPPALRVRRLPPPPRRAPSRRPVPAAPAAPLWPAAIGLGLLAAAGAFGAVRRVRRARFGARAGRVPRPVRH